MATVSREVMEKGDNRKSKSYGKQRQQEVEKLYGKQLQQGVEKLWKTVTTGNLARVLPTASVPV